jgi:hypothetical protein
MVVDVKKYKADMQSFLEKEQNMGAAQTENLKLHLGCGNRHKEGYINVDVLEFEAVDLVHDLTKPWPWADGSVSDILMEHTLEHFEVKDRIFILNEMHRVMKIGGKARILCPIWSSARAYGDPTHIWPPISEWTAAYWNRSWRATEAPHTEGEIVPGMYTCNFHTTAGYGLDPDLNNRSQQYQEMAIKYWKEATRDIVFTLTRLADDAKPVKIQPL